MINNESLLKLTKNDACFLDIYKTKKSFPKWDVLASICLIY